MVRAIGAWMARPLHALGKTIPAKRMLVAQRGGMGSSAISAVAAAVVVVRSLMLMATLSSLQTTTLHLALLVPGQRLTRYVQLRYNTFSIVFCDCRLDRLKRYTRLSCVPCVIVSANRQSSLFTHAIASLTLLYAISSVLHFHPQFVRLCYGLPC